MTAAEQRILKTATAQLEAARRELAADHAVPSAKAATRVDYTIALLQVLGLEDDPS